MYHMCLCFVTCTIREETHASRDLMSFLPVASQQQCAFVSGTL